MELVETDLVVALQQPDEHLGLLPFELNIGEAATPEITGASMPGIDGVSPGAAGAISSVAAGAPSPGVAGV